MKLPRVSLVALIGAQAQVTFNDAAAKLMLIGLAHYAGVGSRDVSSIDGLLAGLLIAPYILLAPLAGWLSDRFPKSQVLKLTLAAQFAVMALLVAVLKFHSLGGAVVCFGLLAVQAALFSPAKRGILREIVGPEKLARAVGWMEMFSVGAMLAGAFVGYEGLGLLTQRSGGDPWAGACWMAVGLTVLAVVPCLLLQLVGATTAQSAQPFRVGLLWQHGRQIAELWRDRPIRRAALGLMFFAVMNGYVVRLLAQIGRETPVPFSSDVFVFSLLMILGIGALLGNLVAGLLSRRSVDLGLAPLGGLVLTTALFALGLVPAANELAAQCWMLLAGFASGFFFVPLYAFVLETAGDSRRGRVLAGIGLLEGVMSLAVGGLYLLVASPAFLHWTPQLQWFALTAGSLAMLTYGLWHLPHETVCTVMRVIGPVFYKVRVRGQENIPVGGALIICNHLSYVDAVVLQIASPRPVRFVAFEGFARSPTLRFLFRATGVIPVTPNKPTKGIRLAVEALQGGELVCVFPEGAISRTGQLMELKRGFGTMATMARVPVVPAVIDGLWGSVFSFASNKYLWKPPRMMPTHVCVLFGAPIPPHFADRTFARKALLDLGAEAFEERPILRRNLAREVVRALARRPWHVELIDRTAVRRELTAAQLLGVAAALSRRIRATIPEKRVGIVLPPGAGATIVNLAVACAGKTPVNLNFTVGRAAVEASLRIGEIRTVFTADAMRAKIPQFPFPEHTLDLKTELEAMGGKRAILPWLLAAWVLPNQWLAHLLGLPRYGDREEAGLLFTSGSSGEPKGVVLTHRNLLANCAQISSLSILPESSRLIGCLPVFHSFGFTVTVWYPLLRGCSVVTIPSPLETRRIVESIQQEKATVMLGAPTFVRPFLKKATRLELASLNLVVTGAEKLPMDLYDAFLAQFGIEILQGYGLTETTPASNLNQPDPPVTTATAEHQCGKRTGAVGRLLPGMTARIVDPDTGEEMPMTSTGMLWLKGANVFPGYLKDPEKTGAALRDGGWFVTGDLGRFDDDGFLFIEGRLSRFSKIGGEMVPHGTVEQRIVEIFGWDQSDGPTAVVVGVPDAAKGEALVLLTSRDIALDELRTKLLAAGLPNLWIPRIVRRVEKIPMLGTGKTDLKGCRNLAIELTKDAAE